MPSDQCTSWSTPSRSDDGRRPDQRRAALVPGLGQIANAERSGDQRDFELVSEHDVQMIGDLVGRDPDHAGPHDIDVAVEALGIEPPHRVGEQFLQAREHIVPERAAAADMVLPQPRLGFLQSHARGFGEQRVAIVGIEALIVEAVAALVQRRQHRRRQVGLVDADGEANVVGAGKERERDGSSGRAARARRRSPWRRAVAGTDPIGRLRQIDASPRNRPGR